MKVRWPSLATFVASIFVTVHSAAGQQEEEPWWAAVQAFHFPHIFVTDLEDFLPQIQNSTADFVLIDFYAPWCPHCQHFAPDFERLGLAIQRYDSAEAKDVHITKKTSILSATVDCVRFAKICSFWGVSSYPTILWGRREDWIKKAQEPSMPPPPEKVEQGDDEDTGQPPNDRAKAASAKLLIAPIDPFDGTAESIVTWINDRTKLGLNISSISKKEVANVLHQSQASLQTVPVAAPVSTLAVAAGVADVWDTQLAVGLLLREILQHHAFEDVAVVENKHHSKNGRKRRKKVKPNAKSQNTTRAAFIDFVGLLANRFPASADDGSSCRESFDDLRGQLRDNWAGMTQEVSTVASMHDNRKLVMIDPDWLEGQWQMCNKDWSRFKTGWRQCRGTWPGKRGFTCGLWNSFHMLAAQTADDTALSDLQTVRTAIGHFFDCQECRDHFMQVPVPEGGIRTRRDAQLWWWNAHNVVNRRVGKLEEMYDDGDPGFVKAQYPSEADCPKCRTPVARPSRNLRARHQPTLASTAETVSAQGTVSPAPPKTAALVEEGTDEDASPRPDVAVESVTLSEAVEREHWDLDEVVLFLNKHYGSPESFF